MAKLSEQPISASITGGYVHIIMPNPAKPTGFESKRIKLEDFIIGGGGVSVKTYANYAALPVTGVENTIYITLDDYKMFIYDVDDYEPIGGGDETDPVFTQWLSDTPPAYPDDIPDITGLLDETAHDLLDHTGLTGVGDMTLAGVQSVTGLKTFDTTKAAIKGSSTGKNILAAANSSATDYTNTLPAKTGTFAMTDITMYNATIGTNGDYANFSTAAAAGKSNLKVISAFNEAGDVVQDNLTIYIPENIQVNMGAYKFNGTNITIIGGGNGVNRGTIVFAYGTSVSLVGVRSSFYNLIITNNSTVLNAGIANIDTIIKQCYLKLSNYVGGLCGISGWFGILEYVTIEGGGSGCYRIMYNDGSQSTPQSNYRGSDIILIGTFYPNADVFFDYWGRYTNIVNHSVTSFALRLFAGVDGLFDFSNTITVYSGNYIYGTIRNLLLNTVVNSRFVSITFPSALTIGNLGNNRFVNCNFSGAITVTGDSCIFIGCTFATTLAISSDYCKMTGCIVTGLLTLSSGAEYNVIQGNTLTGGLTNSSGSATNIIQDNI